MPENVLKSGRVPDIVFQTAPSGAIMFIFKGGLSVVPAMDIEPLGSSL